ncbi:MAG: hypothetical protein WB763_18220 [Terriglobia bacterium]|jgi:hypothetical protein
MPRIYEEVVLSCSREKAFAEMTVVDFIKKSQPDVSIEFETTFNSERLTRYKMKVGKWELESEKVIIPEVFTFVTQRTVSSPAGYSLIIQIFEAHEKGTLLRHIEDFEPQEGEERLSDLKSKVNQYLQGVQKYFGGEHHASVLGMENKSATSPAGR